MLRALLTVTALLSAIVVAAGCGNDNSSSSAAAGLAPAGSLMYGEATLKPDGDQKAAVDSLMAKFPGEGGAGDRIRTLMEKAFAESDSGLSYKKDVEPWLGDKAAFFLSRVSADGNDGEGALLLATEDEDKARATIEKAIDDGKAEATVEAVVRCELFCDEWEQACHGGELTAAAEAGLVSRERVTELGDVLTGAARGRSGADSTTLFDSTGLAIQDLAICLALLSAHRAGRVTAATVRL